MKGNKTILISLVVTILGALETFDFTQLLNEQTAGIVVTVIGAVMAVLRMITSTPVFKKD